MPIIQQDRAPIASPLTVVFRIILCRRKLKLSKLGSLNAFGLSAHCCGRDCRYVKGATPRISFDFGLGLGLRRLAGSKTTSFGFMAFQQRKLTSSSRKNAWGGLPMLLPSASR